MPNIADITNAASYHGDAALGGGGGFALDLDLKPIEQLAQYTFLYNKSQYDQRQKDADQKINELADATSFDLTTARGKDKDEVISKIADIAKAGALYASKGVPNSPQDKINQEIDFQKQIVDAKKAITSGNARGMAYNIQKAAILSSTEDAKIRDEKLKMLDKQFDESDILTPIQAIPNFDQTIPKVSAPDTKATDVVIVTPNGDLHQSVSLFDPKSSMNKAFLEANDLQMPTPPGPNATQLEKDQYAIQSKVKTGNRVWQDAAEFYNRAISDPKYKLPENTMAAMPDINTQKPSNQIDYNAIEADNPILHNVISLIDRYNEYSAERKQDAVNGFYIDKLGNKVKLLQTVNPSDFFQIDKTKPLTPAQVVFLEKFSQASPDTKVEKYTFTGDQTKLTIEKMNEDGLNWRAMLPYTMEKINSGKATKSDIENYPVLKTWEMLQPFIDQKSGTPTNKVIKFSDLTPEQQSKLTTQINAGGTERINPDKLNESNISFVPPSSANPNGQLKITGTVKDGKNDKSSTVLVNPDDITFDYYNSINKNDAGKEGAQRLIFNFNNQPGFNNSNATTTNNNSSTTININNVPAGTKLVMKKGKYYYNDKEVIQ